METNLNYIQNMFRFMRSCLYLSSCLQMDFFSNFSYQKTEDFHSWAFFTFSGIYINYFPSVKNKYIMAIFYSKIFSWTFIYSLSQISLHLKPPFFGFVLMQVFSQFYWIAIYKWTKSSKRSIFIFCVIS